MAEESQTRDRVPDHSPDHAHGQPQQAGEAPSAPQSAWEAAAPRRMPAPRQQAPGPITDWASI